MASNNMAGHREFPKQVHRATFIRSFWDTFFFGGNNKMRIHPLPVLLLYGLAGTLIDFDHFIIQQLQMVRPLHLPYWFIIGLVCICYYTYVHRWIYSTRLKGRNKLNRADKEEQHKHRGKLQLW